MDKGKEFSKNYRSLKKNNFEPNIRTKDFNSCEESFQSLGNGVPFDRKRAAFHRDERSDYDEVNCAKLTKRARILNQEAFSNAIRNSEMFRTGYLYLDAKFRALSSAGGRYGCSSRPSKVLNDDSQASDLPFPEQYTPGEQSDMHTALENFDLMKTLKTTPEFSAGERERDLKRASDFGEPRDQNEDEPLGKNNKESNSVSQKDEERASYWERRRRNNASAKKSRDARKAREIQTQLKVDLLEKENTRLLAELLAIQHENLCLRRVLGIKM